MVALVVVVVPSWSMLAVVQYVGIGGINGGDELTSVSVLLLCAVCCAFVGRGCSF